MLKSRENDTITKDLTTLQACRYTALWNVSVLTASIETKMTSAATYFKKLTGNNMFIASVIG